MTGLKVDTPRGKGVVVGEFVGDESWKYDRFTTRRPPRAYVVELDLDSSRFVCLATDLFVLKEAHT